MQGFRMTKVSLSTAWEETKAIIARDGKLLATVALALFVLPGAISDLVTPQAPSGEFPKPGYWMIVTLIALLIALVGQLAVIRLAIGSRHTVGETIAHAFRRAPAYLGATFIWILPFALIGGGIAGTASDGHLSPAVVAMIFLAIRMLLSSAVASAEGLGPVAILRRSWELTEGNWWRLFGFFVLFVIATLIVLAAVSSVIGLLIKLTFGSLEPLTVGALLFALIGQVVAAAVSVLLMVMLARIYVQLSGHGQEQVFV
jgi:hypothetical protein